jgi:hypothetical protein
MLSRVLPTELLELIFYHYVCDFDLHKINETKVLAREFPFNHLIAVAKKKRAKELKSSITDFTQIVYNNSIFSWKRCVDNTHVVTIKYHEYSYNCESIITVTYDGMDDHNQYTLFSFYSDTLRFQYYGTAETVIATNINDDWLNGKCIHGITGNVECTERFFGNIIKRSSYPHTMSWEELARACKLTIDNPAKVLGEELPMLIMHAHEVYECKKYIL